MKGKYFEKGKKALIKLDEYDPILNRVYSFDRGSNTVKFDPLIISQLLKYLPNIQLGDNILDAYKQYNDIIKRMHEPSDLDINIIKEFFTNRLPLSDEQIRAIHFFHTAYGDLILGDDMGVGKTLSTLAHLEIKALHRILIISPAAGKNNWANEVIKWCIKGNILVVQGTEEERKEQLKDIHTNRFVITNYENLGKYEALFSLKWDLILFDEAHFLKNRNSKRRKEAKKLKAEKKIYMTGTALTNDAGDLWSILNLIDPIRYTSYWDFVKYFANYEVTDFGEKVSGYRADNARWYHEMLKKYMIRRHKVIEAKQIFNYIDIPFSTRQAEAYNRAYIEWRYGKDDIIGSYSERWMRLNQISICPEMLGLDIESGVDSKVIELIQNSNENKIIVGCSFKKHSHILFDKLKALDLEVIRIDGSIPPSKRFKLIEEFKTSKDIRILVATIRSMAEVFSIDECNYMIIADYSYLQDKNKQFLCRIYRPQTTINDKRYDVLTVPQVGKAKLRALKIKQDMVDAILDGKKPEQIIGGC